MLALVSRTHATDAAAVSAAAADTASLEREAYRFLEMLRTNAIPDEDLERLSDVCQELDRRGVPCKGSW
jgi:hypothetical protein